jgi:excisionase family DNA binding protein
MKSAETTYKKPLSVGQVAEICKVSNKTVLNWIYNGALKAFTTYGGHYRLWPSNVRKFLEETRMDVPFEFTEMQSRHILIIDNDALYSGALRDAMITALPGIEVTATDDGYEGLLLIGEIQPELVVLDINLPGINGLRLLNVLRARKRDRDLKVLVVSRLMDRETQALLSSAADLFIEKGSDVSGLLKKIAAFVKVDAVHEHEEPVKQHSHKGDTA